MLHVTFYDITFRPSSAVAMVHHFQILALIVRSFRLLFFFVSSFNTYSLPSINYSASVPHNKFRNQSLFPLLCIVCAVSSSKVHLFIQLFQSSIWFHHQSLLFCLRAIFWLLWVITWCLVLGASVAVFLHFQFSVRVVCLWSRQYSILDSNVHWHLFLHFSSSLLAFNIIFIIDLQIVSSIVGV